MYHKQLRFHVKTDISGLIETWLMRSEIYISNITGDYATALPWTGRQMHGESTVKSPPSGATKRRGPKKLWHNKVKGTKLMCKKKRTTNTYPCCPGVHVIADYMGNRRSNCGEFGGVFPATSSCTVPPSFLVRWCCLHNCWKGVRSVLNRCERFCLTSPPCGTIRKQWLWHVSSRMNISNSYGFFFLKAFCTSGFERWNGVRTLIAR